MASPRWQAAALHLPLFVGLSFLWMVTITVVVSLWMAIDGFETTEALEWLGPFGLGGFTIAQMFGLAALAGGLALLVSTGDPPSASLPAGRADVVARLRLAFPFPPAARWMAVAAVGSLTLWTLPSFVAQELVPLFPDYASTPEVLTTLLRTASLPGKVVVALAVVVSAPLLEELIFRGYLWRVLEGSFGSTVALFGSTVLFATFHLDPIQSLALLPTALFLGWLRRVSGSIGPPMVTHLLNNGLGVALAVSSDEDGEIGLGLALAGFLATIGIAAGGVWLSRRAAPAAP